MYKKTSKKILTNKQVLTKLQDNKDLVFISGCFDILHLGHIQLFREAKKHAGKNSLLLCVLHDDESIKQKKGKTRPINNLESRMQVLSELESVDFVTFWKGWESIEEFFIQIKPGFIAVTEGTFENKNLRKTAELIHTKLIEVKKYAFYSSSNIIEKIAEV